MERPNRIANRNTGRNASTGPGWPSPSRSPAQPHWKIATMRPKQTATASRFMTAVSAAISRLRKAYSSSTAPSSTITPMNSGSRLLMVSVKSTVVAVKPPMYAVASVPLVARGITTSRKRCSRSSVAADCGEVVGNACSTVTRRVGLVCAGVTAATPGVPAIAVEIRWTVAWSGLAGVLTTTNSGALKPGPNPADSASYARRVVRLVGSLPWSLEPNRRLTTGSARTTMISVASAANAAGRRCRRHSGQVAHAEAEQAEQGEADDGAGEQNRASGGAHGGDQRVLHVLPGEQAATLLGDQEQRVVDADAQVEQDGQAGGEA